MKNPVVVKTRFCDVKLGEIVE